ncbi:MAG: hypothetical protein KAW41_06125 [Candidatus Diapherotrites archaeon]|nr:hypothetical protein [Candidatus Diapherotrites archaeon]
MARLLEAKKAIHTRIKKEVNQTLAEMGIKTKWKLKLLSRGQAFKREVARVMQNAEEGETNPKKLKKIKQTHKTLMEWYNKTGKPGHKHELKHNKNNPYVMIVTGNLMKTRRRHGQGFHGFYTHPFIWVEYAKTEGLDQGQITLGLRAIEGATHAKVLFPREKAVGLLIPYWDKSKQDESTVASETGHAVYQVACDHRGIKANHTVHEVFDQWFQFLHGKKPSKHKNEVSGNPHHIKADAVMLRILAESKSKRHAREIVYSLATKEFNDFGEIMGHVDNELAKNKPKQKNWPPPMAKDFDEAVGYLNQELQKSLGTPREREIMEFIVSHRYRGAYCMLKLKEAEEIVSLLNSSPHFEEKAAQKAMEIGISVEKHAHKHIEERDSPQGREFAESLENTAKTLQSEIKGYTNRQSRKTNAKFGFSFTSNE